MLNTNDILKQLKLKEDLCHFAQKNYHFCKTFAYGMFSDFFIEDTKRERAIFILIIVLFLGYRKNILYIIYLFHFIISFYLYFIA